VGNIHECLGIPHPTASRHLAYLRRTHLAVTRKDGLWVHYMSAPLDGPVMRVLMSAVTHVLCHCEAISRDRQRLGARRNDRRRTGLKDIHTSRERMPQKSYKLNAVRHLRAF